MAAVAVACACAIGLAGCSGDEPEVAPTATSTPTETETATAEPTDLPPAAAAEVAVDPVDVELLDNSVLRGEDQREPSPGVVDGAVAQAAEALERYLNTQFVDPGTRFRSEGLEALLEEAVAADLSPEQRQGLGELDLDVDLEPAGPVDARAVVLTDGDELLSVTLVYDASFERRDGGGGAVRQQGQLLFAAAQEGSAWRAHMADVTVEAPEEAAR